MSSCVSVTHICLSPIFVITIYASVHKKGGGRTEEDVHSGEGILIGGGGRHGGGE